MEVVGLLVQRFPLHSACRLLGNNSRFCPTLTSDLMNVSSIISRRYYRRLRVTVDLPWTVKINWSPPPRSLALAYLPRNSGDLDKFDPAEYRKTLEQRGDCVPRIFQRSGLFENADETSKELLSLDYLREKELYEMYKEELVCRVQRHPLDFDSLPAEIGALTAHIRWLQHQLFDLSAKIEDAPVTEHKTLAPGHFFYKGRRRSRFQRAGLMTSIDDRREKLSLLRSQDYKYFEFVLEQLGLVYKPLPVFEHKMRRKESFRRLAAEYVLLLKKERRIAYAQELEEQKEPFLIKKIETLKWIQEEEAELLLSPTVADEDVAAAEAQLARYRKLVAAAKASAEVAAKELARSHGDDDFKESGRKVEDVLAPSKFPVGIWPYDVYQMDEDVLIKPLNVEYKGFQEIEHLDERMYDERLPRLTKS